MNGVKDCKLSYYVYVTLQTLDLTNLSYSGWALFEVGSNPKNTVFMNVAAVVFTCYVYVCVSICYTNICLIE